MGSLVPAEQIDGRILVLRDQKVMLDSDLANLYRVKSKALNQAVKRNRTRFPLDFMFQLNAEEYAALRSQTATLKLGRGQHTKYLPYAFTEQGVAMLSSVLRSKRAILVNIEIMRAFVRLRAMAFSYMELARRVDALEKKYDAQLKGVFDAIRKLMEPVEQPKPQVGFRVSTESSASRTRSKGQLKI